jgi:molybdenum cofactor biosynthesis protein A
MPEDGLEWLGRKEVMSYEEILRISALMIDMGIDKIRITGGEPFVRKDIIELIAQLAQFDKLKKINLTTNGVLTAPYIPLFKRYKINSCNLSLDTLDSERFFQITRRDEFSAVMQTLDVLLTHGIEVKINAVVMNDINTDEIVKMVELTKNLPISMRFIEEMPFNGEGNAYSGIVWNHQKILATIQESYPTLQKIPDPPNSTAYLYKIPNHQGTIGIIAAYTRSFCGSCNRIRLTPDGNLQTCLYGSPVLNVKDMMRSDLKDTEMRYFLQQAFQNRAKDGWEAEKKRQQEGFFASMATIGG